MKPIWSLSEEGLLIVMPEPVRCSGCGAMRTLFQNRDGQTRCAAKCDDQYLKQKEAAHAV